MTDRHTLAIHTYGSQRVKQPGTQRIVSAYKLGYSSAACETLLTLYGDRARDVSSKQASYRYIQPDGETTVRHGYLLLHVTSDELAQAAAVTRRYPRAAVYVWREGAWLELPTSREDRYTAPLAGGPGFDPSGYRPVSPTTGTKEVAVEGIRIEKSQRDPGQPPWYWLLGDTYPHRETLKRCGARFSSKRRAWYFIGWALPDAIQRLVAEVTATTPPAEVPPMSPELEAQLLAVLAADDAAAQQTAGSDSREVPPVDGDQPAVRVLKPATIPADGTPLDPVQTALVQAKAQPAPVLHQPTTSPGRTPTAVGQSYVGEVTGSITGNVWCYGYAIHDGICVFLNIGGPRMAVEAIRAKLGKGDVVTVVPWDAPSVELTAGEGNTGMYHDYFASIPEAKFTSLILCHDWLVNPNYGGKSTTFILRTDEAQAAAKLKQHVSALVKVPVFEAWTGYLYHAGQSAMLVRPTRSAGDIDLLTVDLDGDAWTRLITGGIQQGIIGLP